MNGLSRSRPGARTLTSRQRRAAIILAIVASLFITVDVAAAPFRDARGGVSGVLGSLARATDSVVGPARRFVQGVPDVGANREKIATLEQQNADLRRKLVDQTIDQASADQIAALQLHADASGLPLLPARVIGTGPGQGFEFTVVIDVGAPDGVVLGQTVTAGAGLIGRVVDVQESSSTVLLIGDADAGIGVRNLRTGELGVLRGTGTGSLVLSPLDPAADLKAGDQLVSGPTGESTFVADLLVATITAASRAPSGAFTATASPAASLTALNVVGVLLTAPPPAAGSPIAGRAPLQPGGN
ncbi:MAG: rod shape-determining protein [Pseudonocardiales bacterium]|nr:rod shape-determining protein [Pseudonocardiales bacterium]